jgi:hypothetical protein
VIEISAESACFLYLIIALLVIVLVWFLQYKKSRTKEEISPHSKTFTCEICTAKFLGNSLKPFVRCPECHSLTKTIDTKKR